MLLLFEPINRFGAWQWLALGCRFIIVGLLMHFVFVRTQAKAIKDGKAQAIVASLILILLGCSFVWNIGAPHEDDGSERIGSFVRYRNAYSIGLALTFAAIYGAVTAKKEE